MICVCKVNPCVWPACPAGQSTTCSDEYVVKAPSPEQVNEWYNKVVKPVLERRKVKMTEYHKIETLFERDEKTFVVDPTKIKWPVIATIKEWEVDEKIDGTNIRVMLSEEGELSFGGRTENAQLPAKLLDYLHNKFSGSVLEELKSMFAGKSVVLYGEGYGAGIQKGGCYRPDQAFILFDIKVGQRWWLKRADIEVIANKLGVDIVPSLGRMSLEAIVELVKNSFPSKIGTGMAEGIIARPIEPLFDAAGRRIIIKLKTKDFIAGKR